MGIGRGIDSSQEGGRGAEGGNMDGRRGMQSTRGSNTGYGRSPGYREQSTGYRQHNAGPVKRSNDLDEKSRILPKGDANEFEMVAWVRNVTMRLKRAQSANAVLEVS